MVSSSEICSRRPRSVRWALRMLGVMLLGLLTAELTLRAITASRGWTTNCYAPHLSLYQSDPRLGFGGLKPGYRLRSGAMSITVNSLGFRGAEIRAKKPAGTVRIMLVGGSAIFGYLSLDEKTSSVQLQQFLEERLRQPKIEVINAAVPGYNTMHTLVRFLYRLRTLEPDVLIYGHGFNDLAYITQIERALAEPEIFGGMGSPAWQERLLGGSMLYGFLRYRSRLFVAKPPQRGAPLADDVPPEGWRLYEQNLRTLVQATRLAGVNMVICSQPSLAHADLGNEEQGMLGAGHFALSARGLLQAMQELRRIQQTVARDEQVPFVDLWADIPATRVYFGDVIHLTSAGETRLAQVLGEALLRQGLVRPSEPPTPPSK